MSSRCSSPFLPSNTIASPCSSCSVPEYSSMIDPVTTAMYESEGAFTSGKSPLHVTLPLQTGLLFFHGKCSQCLSPMASTTVLILTREGSGAESSRTTNGAMEQHAVVLSSTVICSIDRLRLDAVALQAAKRTDRHW
jgi:hypothetical protein